MEKTDWINEPWHDNGEGRACYDVKDYGLQKAIGEVIKQATTSVLISCGGIYLHADIWQYIEDTWSWSEKPGSPQFTMIVHPKSSDSELRALGSSLHLPGFKAFKANQVPRMLCVVIDNQKGVIACSQGFKSFDEPYIAGLIAYANLTSPLAVRELHAIPPTSSPEESQKAVDSMYRLNRCIEIDDLLDASALGYSSHKLKERKMGAGK